MLKSCASAALLGVVIAFSSPTTVAQEATDIKRNGEFGLPQANATVLCDNKELRVSVWSNKAYLYVQAVYWNDDESEGKAVDKKDPSRRAFQDTSILLLDLDGNQKQTAKIDRDYSLNPTALRTGLNHQIAVSETGSTALKRDSKGRGSISYPAAGGGRKVRVDCYLLPLEELGKKPGDRIRLALWGASAKPEFRTNSLSIDAAKAYYSTMLPRAKFHEVTLSTRADELDIKLVPDDKRIWLDDD